MPLTKSDEDLILQVVQNNEGKHSDRILRLLAKEANCSTRFAGYLLKEAVKKNLVTMKGLNVYIEKEK
jgi:hypothetical protein